MVDAGHFDRVQHVGHVVVEIGARHGPLGVDGLLAGQEGLALIRRHVAAGGARILHQLGQRGFPLRNLRGGDHVVGEGVDLDDPAVLGEGAEPVVVDIARVVEDRLAARVRQDDRRLGQGQHLVQHAVGRMAGVEHDAQPVGLGHEFRAPGRQPAPFRLVCGAVAQVVGQEVDRSGHPQAERIEGLQQADVAGHWGPVLHADEHEALLGRQDLRHVVGLERDGELGGVLGHHFVDFDGAHQGVVPSLGVAFRASRALRREQGEEAAVHPTVDHARQVHLASVHGIGMPVEDVPAGQVEQGGGVEVCVQHHRVTVGDGPGRRGLGLGGGQGRRRGGG